MEDAGETWEQMKKALLCFCRSEKTFDRVLDRARQAHKQN